MKQELYHEIFGSILERKDLIPYLLRDCPDYKTAMRQATRMMANRGFDADGFTLSEGEIDRARIYVTRALEYFHGWLFPFLLRQLVMLRRNGSTDIRIYRTAVKSIRRIERIISDNEFSSIIHADPRHLFLLASSHRYPELFKGYYDKEITDDWKRTGCSILKMCHLIKSVEEDSQDINDYARLGFFLQSKGISTSNLFDFNWNDPALIPEDDCARKGFVKLTLFFGKIRESLTYDKNRGCYVFNSGDGVQVDIVKILARLKSPESMFTKLGKNIEGEAFDIRDILAISFLLKSRDDSLMLFHALQKQGVILQENTSSGSITQTLFDSPKDMHGAVERLMTFLGISGNRGTAPTKLEIESNAVDFFNALGSHAGSNNFSSGEHRKFQCKINYSLPIHINQDTEDILVPGTEEYKNRRSMRLITQQQSLPVELRISDVQSWEKSEKRGDSHHDAYKCRQLLSLMNRLFSPAFSFPEESFITLREDQNRLFR